MYRLTLLVCLFALCSSGPVLKQEEPHKNVYNHAIDGFLALANGGSPTPNVDDLIVKGLALPVTLGNWLKIDWFKVLVSAAEPSVVIDPIKRLDDAVIVHEDTNVTLSTTLGYDEITLEYKDFQASFWFLKMSGTLAVTVPSTGIVVNVTHRGVDCLSDVVGVDVGAAKFQMDSSSWLKWLINPLLQNALKNHGDVFVANPLKSNFEKNILPKFSDAYCKKASCLEQWE